MARETVLILDYGAQYTQLIARRIRECHVYCEIQPCTVPLDTIKAIAPRAVVMSGGPQSVYGEGSPKSDPGETRLTWMLFALPARLRPSEGATTTLGTL